MSQIKEMLEFNNKFVAEKQYEKYAASKFPSKKTVILSCMDTRLTELLPAALNFKNGDIKIVKNAGAIVSHPFGSIMRSIIIAIYDLGAENVAVIGHHDCGVQGTSSEKLVDKMINRGIKKEKIEFIKNCGVDLDKWLKGFDSAKTSVCETVNIIRNHPLIPEDVCVYGFVIDPETGKLETVS
jgi:carbonic anhydrase